MKTWNRENLRLLYLKANDSAIEETAIALLNSREALIEQLGEALIELENEYGLTRRFKSVKDGIAAYAKHKEAM